MELISINSTLEIFSFYKVKVRAAVGFVGFTVDGTLWQNRYGDGASFELGLGLVNVKFEVQADK
jgi:hypothetical protein